MKYIPEPPSWIDALVDRLAPDRFAEEIREICMKCIPGYRPAWRSRSTLAVCPERSGISGKSFFWKRSVSPTNDFTMIRSYFQMAKRSLATHKGTTAINVIGLITGIASALVIFTVIRYELSFDAFHSDRDRIYRLVRVTGTDLGKAERRDCRTGVSYPVPTALKTEIPAIGEIASVQYFGDLFVEVPDASATCFAGIAKKADA